MQSENIPEFFKILNKGGTVGGWVAYAIVTSLPLAVRYTMSVFRIFLFLFSIQ